jgi:enoyl-CoA hydratase/carnithine racemase
MRSTDVTTPDPTALVDVRLEDGYEVWSMQAGPVNALSPELLAALDAEVTRAIGRESTAVVVLTSGQKVFSAGADATWMAELVQAQGVDALVEEFVRTMDKFRALCVRMRQSPLLFVAALNGHTLAGGLELAAACDLRFSADSDKLRIGVPEMDLFGAMPSGGGGVQFIARLMQPSRALQFILDAKPVSPREGLEAGLVDRLYDGGELMAETERFAGDIARKAGRIGASAAKRAVLGGVELPLYEALELDRSLHWDALRRGNFRRGVQAFVDQYASKNAKAN